MDNSLVGSPKACITQGPPLVSLQTHLTQGPLLVSLSKNPRQTIPWLVLQRLTKPKVCPWRVSPKPRMNNSLVGSPKAYKTQGLPLASLAKIQDRHIADHFSKGLSNSRSALGEPQSSSFGLLNPRSTFCEPFIC